MQIDTDQLKRHFEENPVAFMAAAGGLLIGLSKLIEAVGNTRGSNAYARQVNYRIRHKK